MNKNFDITGDGTLYINGMLGLISRHPFLDEELPEDSCVYLLHHPKHKRHSWILENLNEVDVIPRPRDNYGFASDEPPEVAFVCFCFEPEFDYLEFDAEDYDTHIEWGTGHTMQFILDNTTLEEE